MIFKNFLVVEGQGRVLILAPPPVHAVRPPEEGGVVRGPDLRTRVLPSGKHGNEGLTFVTSLSLGRGLIPIPVLPADASARILTHRLGLHGQRVLLNEEQREDTDTLHVQYTCETMLRR